MSEKESIHMVLSVADATCIASLLQLALRHPHVKIETPHLYVYGRKFTEQLIDSIAYYTPEYQIMEMFDLGWNARHDVTAEEFDRFMENSLNSDDN
jgi:hypothetical protein